MVPVLNGRIALRNTLETQRIITANYAFPQESMFLRIIFLALPQKWIAEMDAVPNLDCNALIAQL